MQQRRCKLLGECDRRVLRPADGMPSQSGVIAQLPGQAIYARLLKRVPGNLEGPLSHYVASVRIRIDAIDLVTST